MYDLMIGDLAYEKLTMYSNAVEGATISDTLQFQLNDIGLPSKIHISAGHCDIVRASMEAFKSGKTWAPFDSKLNDVIREYTKLIMHVRQLAEVDLVLYPLRKPEEYLPKCATKPFQPYYDAGVAQLNGYIKGWGSKLNFATIYKGKEK